MLLLVSLINFLLLSVNHALISPILAYPVLWVALPTLVPSTHHSHHPSPPHTHTHTRLMALFPGLPRWAGTRKVKPIWIWLNQETVSGSGISWAMCKSAPHSRQITTPAPHHSVFYRPDALPAAERTASKHITPSLTVILVSQITLVSLLVYNYSLVLVFRRILVLVFTFGGILVSVSGLFQGGQCC